MTILRKLASTCAIGAVMLGASSSVVAGDNQKVARAWIWSGQANSTLNQPVTVNSNYRHVRGYERLNYHPYRDYFGSSATVTRTGTGRYQVRLIDMDTAGGVAHVNSYGSNRHCKVQNWYRSGNDQLLNVRCFTAAGALSNSRFVLNYNTINFNSNVHQQAHLWANQPTSSNYVPSSTYSRNTSGQSNRVYRLGNGYYRVMMPGVHNVSPYGGEKGGTVMVTAYGTDNVRCKSAGWSFSGNNVNAYVRCYNGSGSAANSRFTLSFLKEMGDFAAMVGEETLVANYAWVNTTPNPSNYYQHNTYGSNTTVAHLGTGRYRVNLTASKALNDTAAFVTAYGHDSNYCTVGSWYSNGGSGTSVYVNCYNRYGSLTNARFNIQYLTNQIILF